MQYVGFAVLAVIAVGTGIAVFLVDSMARATFALSVSFVAVGCELFLLNAVYLAVITMLMMVMEMAIMAVYMVAFMMNPGGLMPMSMVHGKRAALSISITVFALLAVGAVTVPWPQHRSRRAHDVTHALGESLMGSKMLVMIAMSAVLFATIVSALTLAAPRNRYDREPSEPGRGT
jgi:NADH:ubiquinone oxidoreductase subunit 6 (subunit J)